MMAPTLGTGVSSLPPKGALAALGRPGGGSMAPTLGTGVSSLPPKGALAALGRPGGGSAASMPLLQVRDLTVRFGAKEVVRSVNFSIAQGEKLALVGESGSGKTITALSLLRLAGEAKISGQAMLRKRPWKTSAPPLMARTCCSSPLVWVAARARALRL